MSTKTKFITNKELLREIHISKASYCYFEDDRYIDYDVIVHDLSEITDDLIQSTIEKKRRKLAKETGEDCDITTHDLVFRLMTHEHIPVDPSRKRKARSTEVAHAWTNFPPFKHYVLRNGVPVEVGRSHWKGDLETGEFCVHGGRATNRLATMWMMMVERYSTQFNWRGYSYRDEMCAQALLQLSLGGLQFDESRGDNPFSFYTTTIKHCFTRILNVEKRNQRIRDELLIMSGATPSHTRQLENEFEQRTILTDQANTVKRKRKNRKECSEA